MLTVRSGDASLVLAPEIGGAIVGWSLGATQLLRRALPEAIMTGNARGLGCFPLVPFSNRIADGQFRWDGTDYSLDRNFGDHPHRIHGVGWQSAWTVASVGAAAATLALHHDAAGAEARRWPFPFAAEQHFALEAEALHVSLTLRNLHQDAAPAGLGLHPQLPSAGGPTLSFHAGSVWLNGLDMLPIRQVPIPADWNNTTALPVGAASLDNCFADWDGTAHIAWPNVGMTIVADGTFRHLIVYTPPGRDFFCVEPVSHANDAINRMTTVSGHGMRILAPGETMRGAVTFRITHAG